jgi:hypothetical protein
MSACDASTLTGPPGSLFLPTSDEELTEEAGVFFRMVCDICGAEFWWNVGVDPDDTSCATCQNAAPQVLPVD